MNVTLIVLTKDRPRMVKRLIDSILKANIDSFSLVLIDDSNRRNFLQTENFLQSLSVSFIQLSTLKAGRHIEKTLEKTNLTSEEKRFIRNCTGLECPFRGYIQRFYEREELKSRLPSGLRFAPYSPARNLGIYCAVKFFNPDTVFFLDDDCLILEPEKLGSQLRLIGTNLNQRNIRAIAGIYKNLHAFETERSFERSFLNRTLRILRGMDAFFRKSFADEEARFRIMPPHMLGGALILSKKVFYNLPFDPYVARGEDHAYAWDLKGYLGKNEVDVRDNHFVVGHQREEVSQKQEDTNVLRDIFRFVYLRAKTGHSFIPFFGGRWTLASLMRLFLNTSKYKQCKNELLALFFSLRFAKKNTCKFRQNLRAWNNFLNRSKS